MSYAKTGFRAEGLGFEPRRLETSPMVFKTIAFVRSAIPP